MIKNRFLHHVYAFLVWTSGNNTTTVTWTSSEEGGKRSDSLCTFPVGYQLEVSGCIGLYFSLWNLSSSSAIFLIT